MTHLSKEEEESSDEDESSVGPREIKIVKFRNSLLQKIFPDNKDLRIRIRKELFTDEIEFESYEDIYESIGKRGFLICQREMTQDYIDSLIKQDLDGFVVKKQTDKLTVGFLLWEKMTNETTHIVLICAMNKNDDDEIKGLPLGVLMMRHMEEIARKNKVKFLIGESVPQKLWWYEKLGWEVSRKKRKDEHTTPIKLIL